MHALNFLLLLPPLFLRLISSLRAFRSSPTPIILSPATQNEDSYEGRGAGALQVTAALPYRRSHCSLRQRNSERRHNRRCNRFSSRRLRSLWRRPSIPCLQAINGPTTSISNDIRGHICRYGISSSAAMKGRCAYTACNKHYGILHLAFHPGKTSPTVFRTPELTEPLYDRMEHCGRTCDGMLHT